ncbi:MAG: hypothetical protein H6713_41720 [Myxococcales bacterium]|nr:hypothetical protein [Myxococcales bacterium]
MEWLKQSWKSAGFASSDDLARRINAPERYNDIKPLQDRSLGNNLRALSRGERLAWWRKQPALLDALAEAIKTTSAELRERLFRGARAPAGDDVEPERVRVAALGSFRPLKLRDEDLPQGIPGLVTRPATWRRLWWRSFDGEARTLAGRWLAARRMATVITASTWERARRRLPERGRVLVLIDGVENGELDWAALADDRVLDDLQVCIAACFPPDPRAVLHAVPGRALEWTLVQADSRATDTWQVVESVPGGLWLAEVLRWAVARLPKQSRVALSVLEALIADLGLRALFAGPCDALDFVGFVTALGVRERPLTGCRKSWALARFEAQLGLLRADQRAARALLENQLGELVVGLVVQAVQHSQSGWMLGQERAIWLKLIQSAAATSTDLVTAGEILAQADGDLPADRVAEVRRAIQPDRGRLVDALLRARVLHDSEDGRSLRLQPAWAGQLIYAVSIDPVLDERVAKIGAAVLQPHLVEPLLDCMIERLLRRETNWAERVLNLWGRFDDVRHVAACELVACAIGVVAVTSSRPPEPLMSAALSVLRATLFLASIGNYAFVVPIAGSTSSRHNLEGALGWFARHVLRHEVEGARLTAHDARGSEDGLFRSGDIVPVLECLSSGEHLIRDVYRYGPRLIDDTTIAEDCGWLGQVPPLRPALLFIAAKREPKGAGGVLSTLVGRDRFWSPELFRGIVCLGQWSGLEHEDLLSVLWDVWARSEVPELRPPLTWVNTNADAARGLWRFGSAEAKKPFLRALAQRSVVDPRVLEFLDNSDWTHLIRMFCRGDPNAITWGEELRSAEFWAAVPDPVLPDLLHELRLALEFTPAGLESAWRRVPELMLEKFGVKHISAASRTDAPRILEYFERDDRTRGFADEDRAALLVWTGSLLDSDDAISDRALRLQKYVIFGCWDESLGLSSGSDQERDDAQVVGVVPGVKSKRVGTIGKKRTQRSRRRRGKKGSHGR